MRCTDLEADDEVEEEDHVDDAIDDSLLDGDHKKHGRTHEDPVLAAQMPQEVPCNKQPHDVNECRKYLVCGLCSCVEKPTKFLDVFAVKTFDHVFRACNNNNHKLTRKQRRARFKGL